MLSTKHRAVVFDLDGTLTESKQSLDQEMAVLLCQLLEHVTVAVISGAAFNQFEKQFLNLLRCTERFEKLLLFPTCGAAAYQYTKKAWRIVYEERLPDVFADSVEARIVAAFKRAGVTLPEQTWGEPLEDRGCQVTYSVLGQEAPLKEKVEWDPKGEKRMRVIRELAPEFPDFEVRSGGTTSIDITLRGIDKAYGVQKIHEVTGIPISDMLFIGDALYPGGNDHAVVRTGIKTKEVSGPVETKEVVQTLLET